MQAIRRMLSGLTAMLLLLGTGTALAQGPRVVLFQDPALSAERLHYPLLISEGRGYRILCASQDDEEGVIRGLGFTTVPSQILTAVDADVVAADPTSNPVLCPHAPDFAIQVFANEEPEGLVHYLQFPSARGSSSYTDRIYVPGCVGLVTALKIDLSLARAADPRPFFSGKIHKISCLSGAPIEVAPKDFSAWCMKGDRTPAETATVMAMLDATPAGVAALGTPAGCAMAQEFLASVPTLNLNGKGVQSLAPLSVLEHLTSLSLGGNAISDLSPLTKLRHLTSLDLSGNKITSVIALAPLSALTRLNLADNQITDIRFLSALALLTSLSLDGNAVADLLPLQPLQALSQLSLARNGLTGAMLEPLTALGALTVLDLSHNNIESFAHLGQFPSTVEINLGGNPIAAEDGRSFLDQCILHRDAPTPLGQTIRAIVAMHGGGACEVVNNALLAQTTLDLSGKAISDVRPLGVLTHLVEVNLSNNAIGDVSALSGLVRLVKLNLSGNNITDIRPVGPLKMLATFDASGNPVAVADFLSACLMRGHENLLSATQAAEVNVLLDVSGRVGCQDAADRLRQMTSATAKRRGLTTLEYFPVLENVQTLDLSENDLVDLSALSPIQGLTSLTVENNKITSLAALRSLRRLERLWLDGNPLNSLNGIEALSRLKSVSFSSTNVRSVQPLTTLPLLEAASMRNLSLSFDSFSEYCLVNRFDPIALGSDGSFLAAVDGPLEAARVDGTDCDAVEQWARTVSVLNLNKKSIASVKPIVFFTALQELTLFDNLIRDVQPIGKLRQLRKLVLNTNSISSLPRFESSGMQVLDLDDNDVSSISSLSNLTQLQSLSLRNNEVTDPSAAGGFTGLTWLDLRDNKIGSVEKAGSVLARNPYLKGNPVCQIVIYHPALNEACRREPPRRFIGVLDIESRRMLMTPKVHVGPGRLRVNP